MHVGVKSRCQQRVDVNKDPKIPFPEARQRRFTEEIFGYSLRSYTFPAYFYSPLKLMFMTMDLRLHMGMSNT